MPAWRWRTISQRALSGPAGEASHGPFERRQRCTLHAGRGRAQPQLLPDLRAEPLQPLARELAAELARGEAEAGLERAGEDGGGGEAGGGRDLLHRHVAVEQVVARGLEAEL